MTARDGNAPATAAASASDTLPVANRVGLNLALWCACQLSRAVSPATWFDWDDSEKAIHRYVVFWLALLGVMLIFWPTSGWLRFAALVIVFYRLQDVIFSTLDNALKLTARSPRLFQTKFSWQTPVMLALVNILQIVLIFAIAYLLLTGQNPAAFSHAPVGRFGAFFLSWISLPPLGGGAAPISIMARVLTISEEATGLLIIVIAIGRFLAADS